MVSVELLEEARTALSELPRLIVVRLEGLLDRLRHWPDVSGVKYLRGKLAGRCRLRTGDYRLQFHVQEKKRTLREKRHVKGREVLQEKEVTDFVIIVEKIGHRDGFYEE